MKPLNISKRIHLDLLLDLFDKNVKHVILKDILKGYLKGNLAGGTRGDQAGGTAGGGLQSTACRNRVSALIAKTS